MAIYERFNARVDNYARLRRNFFNDGILFDPFKIDKIEIWKTRYDPEYEAENPGSLLMDTLYGSRLVLGALSNNAYNILGLESGQSTPDIVTTSEFELDFTSVTSVTVPHNLGDRYPIVTVYDNLGVVLIPDTITSVDANTVTVTFVIPQSGTIDVLGATSVGSGIPVSTVKKYQQSFVDQIQVTVNHNLNDDMPNVVIYDGSYNQIFPDSIQSLGANSLVINFGIAQSGTIIIVGGNAGYAVAGFGAQAEVIGTVAEPFYIFVGQNDRLLISVDGGADQSITLPQKCYVTATDIVATINATLTDAYAEVYDTNKVRLVSNSYGMSASIELKTVINAAYATIGWTVGVYNGLGYPPAQTIGTRSGTFTITDTTKWLKLSFDGGADFDIDLLEGDTVEKLLTANQIAAIINSATDPDIRASVDANRYIQLDAVTSVEIKAVADNAYTELGFVIGLYGPSYTGSSQEYYTIDSTNFRMRITNNYQPWVDVNLSFGNLTIFDIVSEINAVLVTNGIDAIAEVSTGTQGGKLILRSLKNDGIKRLGVGQYYVDYLVPTTFVEDGVFLKRFLDVWYYAPIQLWDSDIADDTDAFIVYADNYFLDSGFSNYDFAFTLMRDLYYKGEIRYLITKVTALPKYSTPIINDWIMPLANAQYRIYTDENTLIQDWLNTDVNSGTEIRIQFDTTNPTYREGLYNLQLKINLPNGEIVLSNRLKFRVTAK